MTATISGSSAVVKTLYPKGELPKSGYQSFPMMAMAAKKTDFKGVNAVVALQTEYPQGVGIDIGTAQGALAQGTYKAFTVTRQERFAVARIKGQALKACEGNEGALVDLWKNECDGASMSLMKDLEIFWFGSGTGTRGAATFSTVTATLSVTSNAINFDLGMKVGAVSDNTTSPTARSGSTTITGIDRLNGTLTSATNWTTAITGLTNGDFLLRYGDAASSGTVYVPFGLAALVEGGTSPSAIYSLTRSTDPVRLAGQTSSYAGIPMEEAIVDADGAISVQWMGGGQKVLLANNKDVANMKKQLGAKVNYDRAATSVAGVSFKSIEIEGDGGPIKVVANPFCPRNTAYLGTINFAKEMSLGPAPHLQDYDKNDFLRVATDDALEARFAYYGNRVCELPVSWYRLTSFGA